MARMTIRDVGALGLISDVPSHELPPEAWSGAENVVFQDNYVEPAPGDEEVFPNLLIQPYRLFYSPGLSGTPYWLACGSAKVYAIAPGDTITYTNIVRASGGDYGGSAWNGGWLNGVFILNNGVDKPQFWGPINTSTLLADLTNWPSTWKAAVVRPFGNFLLALDITKSTTRYPTLMSWSHPADPGSVPSSWDVADTTKLTGDKTFTNTSGALVDCLPLRDANIVYKEDAIILQQFIGGNDIFAWRDISTITGLAGQNCAVEFKPGYHVLLTKELDIVVCNGQTIESVASGKIRNALKNLSRDYLANSFAVNVPERTEVWFGIPSLNSYAERLFVWNYKTGAWGMSYLDAGGMHHAARGGYKTGTSAPVFQTVLAARPSTMKVYQYLNTLPCSDLAAVSYVERTGLALVGQGRDGTPRVDYTKHKVVTEIWPLIDAAPGTDFTVTIEGINEQNDFTVPGFGVNAQSFTFTPGTDTKIDCLVEGRYINIRFEVLSSVINWKIHGYSLELNIVGEYA